MPEEVLGQAKPMQRGDILATRNGAGIKLLQLADAAANPIGFAQAAAAIGAHLGEARIE